MPGFISAPKDKLDHNRLIFIFLISMNVLLVSAIVFIGYELHTVDAVVEQLAEDVDEAVDVVQPFLKNMEIVSSSMVEVGKSANLVYVSLRKRQRAEQKLEQYVDVNNEQVATITQQMRDWHQQGMHQIQNIREIVDQGKRVTDESGGHFQAIEREVTSFQAISGLKQVLEKLKLHVAEALSMLVIVSLLTSFFLLRLIRSALQSQTHLAQNWVKSKLAGLHERMRGELNTKLLAETAMEYLATVLKLPLGALYCVNQGKLHLAATYAYVPDPQYPNEFPIGQGLPGQAAKEKRSILFHDVPKDYIKVQSALGNAHPRHVQIMPFIFENEVKGVIELGLMEELSTREQEFIIQALDALAISIHSADYRSHLQQLLEDSQMKSEELEVQREEIQRQREWFETTLASIADGIITTDTQGYVTLMNSVAEQLTSWSSKQAVGLKIQQVFQTADEHSGKKVTHLVEQILAEDEVTCLGKNLLLMAANGRQIPIENSGAPIRKPGGDLEGVVLIFRDISERRQAEQALEQARQEAVIANQAKSRFLANMSHELRTPLNGILGYAQILERGELTPKQQEGISIIRRSGNYLLTLINDILDLSKIEADRIELYPVDFNFSEFIQELVELFGMRAKQKGIQFDYQALSHLPLGIHADDKRLRQILINLLGNAIKFTKQGNVKLKIGWHEHKIRFQVEDSGPGIASEDLDKIFLPFQQVGTIADKAEGTGLGLSITKKLVELMGGELHVESTLGQGSCFWIVLPLREATLDTARHVVPQKKIIGFSEAACTILVVDDKLENRQVLKHLLAPLGFEILEAENGQQGLELSLAKHPQLVLMDLVMPVMDGFEATRAIRTHAELDTVVIIAASASVFDEDQRRSLEAGCNDFTAKPIQADALLQQIQQHLQLTWVYEQEESQQAEKLSSTDENLNIEAALQQLTSQQRAKLYHLSLSGDVNGVLEQCQNLLDINPEFVSLAETIRNFARGFDTDEICLLLEPYLED